MDRCSPIYIMETEEDSRLVRSCPGLGDTQYSSNVPQPWEHFVQQELFLEEVFLLNII